MGMLGSAVYRFACCVVVSSILISLVPDGRMKELLHICFGIFLTVILLSVFSVVQLPDPEDIRTDYLQQAQSAADAGEAYARQQYREFIKQKLEAYILDIAKEWGCTLTVHVDVDEEGYPVSVTIWSDVTDNERKQLERYIAEELGISKEDQQWNGLQTRNDSAPP